MPYTEMTFKLDQLHECLDRATALTKILECLDSRDVEVADMTVVLAYLLDELEQAQAHLDGVLLGAAGGTAAGEGA